jgi:hypothetical protein
MKSRNFVLGLLIALAALCTVPTIVAQTKGSSPSKLKLRELLSAKRDALKERHAYVRTRFEQGVESYDAVLQAQELYLRTELELATAADVRRAICNQRVEVFRQLEERASKAVKDGTTTLDANLLATANRIQAEIDCLEGSAEE